MTEVLLDPKPQTLHQAADGRFFMPQDEFATLPAGRLFDASEEFWQQNQERLGQDSALVYAAAAPTPDSIPPASNGQKTRSVLFDGRLQNEGIYRWQTIEAYEAKYYGYPEIRQNVYEVCVSANQLSGRNYMMDDIGNLCSMSYLAAEGLIEQAVTLVSLLSAGAPETWRKRRWFKDMGFIALRLYDPLKDDIEGLQEARRNLVAEQLRKMAR